jgi:hypothetical protein
VIFDPSKGSNDTPSGESSTTGNSNVEAAPVTQVPGGSKRKQQHGYVPGRT